MDFNKEMINNTSYREQSDNSLVNKESQLSQQLDNQNISEIKNNSQMANIMEEQLCEEEEISERQEELNKYEDVYDRCTSKKTQEVIKIDDQEIDKMEMMNGNSMYSQNEYGDDMNQGEMNSDQVNQQISDTHYK